MTAFQTFVSVDGVSTRVDRSVKVVLSTQELSPEAAGQLFGLAHKQLYAAFLETPISVEDIEVPKEEPEFKGEKSPAQRLRAVMYVRWKQKGRVGDFEAHYRSEIEKYIDLIKEELEPE